MEIATLAISILSIGISAFTFWWTSVRRRVNLYLFAIQNTKGNMLPEFALVNGGDHDVLFTRIECGFVNAEGNATSYPAQTLSVNESTGNLLGSGKAFHCRIVFNEEFGVSFAKQGQLREDAKPPVWVQDMQVSLGWVRPDGKEFKRAVKLYTYGFNEKGEIRLRKTIARQVALHVERPRLFSRPDAKEISRLAHASTPDAG